MPIDNVLKLYSETIRSSFLHYGFWDDPTSIDVESITLQKIKDAQTRYIEHLESYIPASVNSILDVGCGIGGNTDFLIKKGYNVETLSPDDFQKSIILKKFHGKVPFYHCKFEKFEPQKKYDFILESESACYINIDEGFKKAREVLCDGGYLLASDYFIHYNDSSRSPHLKSSHDLNKYLSCAKVSGFEIVKEYDQTENTMLTLDYAKYLIDRFIYPTLDYGIFSTKKKYPKITGLIGKIMKTQWTEKKKQLDLIDSSLFRKYRKYMIYLFKKIK